MGIRAIGSKINLAQKAFFVLLFISCNAFAQLQPFAINVTATPQTCLGNGTLSFSVTGNNPAAAMEYAIYLLPDTTTPVTTITTTILTSLVAGDYKVVATQSLNGQANTATGAATIINNTTPFAYTTTIVNPVCNSLTGSITVVVTLGAATGYEIISGPQIRPLQANPVFSNLPPGQYQIRVFNPCGNAVVTTVSLTTPAYSLMIGEGSVQEDGPLNSCRINVTHNFGNYPTAWPVKFDYTVFPPGGGVPQLVTNIISEPPWKVTTAIPFYNGQLYTYNIKITDACGNTYTKYNNQVIKTFKFDVLLASVTCGQYYIGFKAEFFNLPFTVTFLNAPAGFNPALYNAAHPFINSLPGSYGSSSSPLPYGSYSIKITDVCGSTLTKNFTISDGVPPAIQKTLVTSSCFTDVRIFMPFSNILTISLIASPPLFTNSLPADFTPLLAGGALNIDDMPTGTYQFAVTESCGKQYMFSFDLEGPPLDPLLVSFSSPGGCAPGLGMVNLGSSTYRLQSVTITQAPALFQEQLPYNASAHLMEYNGFIAFEMLSLPEGLYHFETIDECGNVRNKSVFVHGYELYENNIQVIRNCSSFDLDINYNSDSQFLDLLYLQKRNTETGEWVHPVNGFVYAAEETIFSTSIVLQNYQLNMNYALTGEFRILKAPRKGLWYAGLDCVEEIFRFTYEQAPEITGAYSFPCTNGLSEVLVDAVGVAPLKYEITTKNGADFYIDNGQSNYFSAIENAVYNFRVTDACNNISNIPFDITGLNPLVITPNGFCPGAENSISLPAFTFLTYEWKKQGSATVVSTSNKIIFPAFNPVTDSGTYTVHITSDRPGSCIDVELEYIVAPSVLPNAGDDNAIVMCATNVEIDLNDYLGGVYDTAGTWQDANATGQLAGSLLSPEGLEAGTYRFIYRVISCEITDEAIITVNINGLNSFDVMLDGGCDGEDYIIKVVNLSDLEGAVFTWTGPEGYNYEGEEANISGLAAGEYHVEVTNADGCTALAPLNVLNTYCKIPKGISPNGDEYNNNFDLSNFDVKEISIFNRYGMKVYEKTNYTNEWHGQSKEGTLPTGTYFYVINLQSGKKMSGWVYLQAEM